MEHEKSQIQRKEKEIEAKEKENSSSGEDRSQLLLRRSDKQDERKVRSRRRSIGEVVD